MSTSSGNLFMLPVWGLFLLGLVAVMYFAQAIFIPVTLAMLESKLRYLKQSLRDVRETTETFNEITSIGPTSVNDNQVVVQGQGLGGLLLDSTQSFLIGLVSFTVLLYFQLAFGDSFMKHVGELGRNSQLRTTLEHISQRIRCDVGHYLFVITLINLILGVATTLTMYWLDMPTPIVWGTFAAILNFIPYLGPAINISLIGLVSILTFNTADQMWQAPVTALMLNLLEGQILQPIFVGNLFRLNPVMVFISILVWGWLWGIVGVLIAIPILMIIRLYLMRTTTRVIGVAYWHDK